MTRPKHQDPIEYTPALRQRVRRFAAALAGHDWEDAADWPAIDGLYYLGSGAYREVYTDGDLVYKWSPSRPTPGIRNAGPRANRGESRLFAEMREAGETCVPFARFFNCGNFGTVIVMRRVNGWHPDEWYDVDTDVWSGPRAAEFEHLADRLCYQYGYGDMHSGNVLVDYETDEIILIDGGL